jgi:beta-lactamase class D
MSDGITEARRGTYFGGGSMTAEEYRKSVDLYYEKLLEKIPIEYIERYMKKIELNNVEFNKNGNV